MPPTQLLHIIQNLKRAGSNGRKNIHKPLTLLYAIGQLLREDKPVEVLLYADHYGKIKELMEAYGPWQKSG